MLSHKVNFKSLSMLVGLLIMALPSLAEQHSKDKELQEEVEKVEVVGTKPLYYYRQQMAKTELDFYDAFNDLVEDPKFKVKCKNIPREGAGRITQRACYPQYFLARKSKLTEIAMRARVALPSDDDVAMQVQQEKKASLAYAEKLIESNPELKQRLLEMYQAKQVYFSKQQGIKGE
ncbi:hypothetical protein AB6T38_18750 [Aliiglaciecola sp. SL4]|uniref:hypothetical protein n=1 Tax=Aliiglaciecola sp. SL4 TaxID=3239806 RepID=UPI00355BBEE4